MSLNVAKLKLIQDVEDRLNDEVSILSLMKNQLMQVLNSNSTQERDVRFSELIYDESCELLVKTINSLKNHPMVQEYQAQVKRIYKFRVEAATKNSLFEVTESPWIVHAEVAGNILERASYNKDLLKPFFNKALPKHLRRNVWRALLTYPEAEQEYIDIFKEARWKTLSLNEVEITRKSVELLSEHCHSLAFNEKIVTAMKVVLSYVEKIIQRRLPEYMYYLLLPIMYTLTDLTSSLPRLVGICLKIMEIQTTVWLNDSEQGILGIFFSFLKDVNPSLSDKINSLIDLTTEQNKLKLENFIRPFLSRLGSGFFNIETTCVIFDQFIMINSLNKIYLILTLCLDFLSDKLLKADHWDDFLSAFFKEIRKINPFQMESLLERLPESEDIESRVKVPLEYRGQEYLKYVLDAQQSEEELKINKLHEFGELISAKRILAENPVAGVYQQKMMKGNLMAQALNKSKDFPGRKTINKKLTLINANLTRISLGSRNQSKPSGEFSETFKEQDIGNISKDVLIEENPFPKKERKLSAISKNSIFHDTSLDELRKSISPNKESSNLGPNKKNSYFLNEEDLELKEIRDVSGIKSQISDRKYDKLSNKSGLPPSDELRPNSQNKIPSNKDSFSALPDLSYLEGGLLAVPDLDALKPGLLDGFED